MKINEKQAQALKALADAYADLAKVWEDDFGNVLADCDLLPKRDLVEAAHQLWHVAHTKEVIE
jgi:uncharacterized protein YcsI (UPF0317 family)